MRLQKNKIRKKKSEKNMQLCGAIDTRKILYTDTSLLTPRLTKLN